MKGAALILVLLAGGWLYLYRAQGRNNSLLDVAEVNARFAQALVKGGGAVGMNLSQAGLQKIADREGFSATRYPDADGFSIGYGHFIRVGESFYEPMPKAVAWELLQSDAEIAVRAVRAYVKVPLTQGNFDALVSMVYNIGAGAFSKSGLLAKLNAGDYAGAAASMAQWNKVTVGGVRKVFPPLIARRADEVKQFWA